MDLEGIMLNETGQTERDKYYTISESKKERKNQTRKIQRTAWWLSGRGLSVGETGGGVKRHKFPVITQVSPGGVIRRQRGDATYASYCAAYLKVAKRDLESSHHKGKKAVTV